MPRLVDCGGSDAAVGLRFTPGRGDLGRSQVRTGGRIPRTTPRRSKRPTATQQDKIDGKPLLIDQVTGKMMAMGVSCVGWVSHLVIAPPLIITEAEMDEGVRMAGNLRGCAPDDVRAGMRVEVTFEDVTPEVTLPQFRLA